MKLLKDLKTPSMASFNIPLFALVVLSLQANLAVTLSEFTSVDVYKTVEMVDDTVLPNIFRFNVSVYQWNSTHSAPVNLTLRDGHRELKVYWGDGFEGPSILSSNFKITDDSVMKWESDDFTETDVMFLSYKSTFVDDGENTNEGKHYYNASVEYILTYDNASFPEPSEIVEWPCCVDVRGEQVDDLFTDYGFTVLAVVCAFIVGVLIVILILFIITKVRRKTPFSDQVHPYGDIEKSDANHHHSSSSGTANGAHNIHGTMGNKKTVINAAYDKCKKLGPAMVNGSIVSILSINDKLNMIRRMDDEDINQTMKMERDLEKERCDAMINGTTMLVDGMKKDGEIPKGVVDKCNSDMASKINDMEKKGDVVLRNDLESMLNGLGKKQKSKIEQLKEKQDDDVVRTRNETSNLSPVEQKEVMGILRKQHDSEMDDLLYNLKLEQDETIENVRNDHAIKNRLRLKEIQQEYLKDIEKRGELRPDQMAWLMSEHYKQQSALDKLYDDEKARARMVLEEKMARRRALAEKHQVVEEDDSEVLNTIAMQQIGLIQSAKKNGILSPSEAKALTKEYETQMIAVKEKMDAEKERQRAELNRKLSERKKKQMEELAKKQQQEVNDINKKLSVQMSNASTDPMNIIESKQTMVSHHRSEMADLENQLDIEHSDELVKLDDDLMNNTKDELLLEKDKLSKKLGADGLSDAKLQKILSQHDNELQDLEAELKNNKAKQANNFKQKLAEHKAAMAQQRDIDRQEQDQLREHEENIVRKIMDNQVSLSDEERNKIMKEHEELMAKLDNGLTLTKLKQKKLLEEKITKRRNQQMEKLQKKQELELKKQRRVDDDDSEEDNHKEELDLMKRQAEDRLKLIKGDDLDVENELADIQDAMMNERQSALKEQEVKLAAMIANLQMEKANEMSKIEEQEKAIHALKANLMDDLNDKGALSDPECQRVIQMHQEQQEELQQKLESQRDKQEKQLKRRLQERLQQKEEQIARMQKAELKSVSSGGNFAAKIRRAAMVSRHMVEMEKFRNQMDKEISQTLEEMRRQSDIRKKNAVQEQELQFLNGLVRLGKFNKAELHNVVQMLLPNKSDEEIKGIMDKLLEGYTEPKNKDEPQGESTLEDRVLATTLSQVDEEAVNESMRDSSLWRGSKKSKGKKSLPPIRRASKIKASPRYSDEYDSEEQYDARRGSQLPPIGEKKLKKKMSRLRRNSDDY